MENVHKEDINTLLYTMIRKHKMMDLKEKEVNSYVNGGCIQGFMQSRLMRAEKKVENNDEQVTVKEIKNLLLL